VREPKFFDKGASRLDLHQGNIGQCSEFVTLVQF